jgi:hypothetical protein
MANFIVELRRVNGRVDDLQSRIEDLEEIDTDVAEALRLQNQAIGYLQKLGINHEKRMGSAEAAIARIRRRIGRPDHMKMRRVRRSR